MHEDVETINIAQNSQHFGNILPVPISHKTFLYMLAGVSARICGTTITSPLDTIKARLQFIQKTNEVRQFTSISQLTKYMLYNEGIISFYRGLPVRYMYVCPAGAISFFLYEQFRFMFYQPKSNTGDYIKLILPIANAGLVRVISTTIRTPFDVIRQRMQVMGNLKVYNPSNKKQNTNNKGIYNNSFHAARTVIRNEGMKGLFTGVTVTISRDILSSVIYFLSYESIKVFVQSNILLYRKLQNNNNNINAEKVNYKQSYSINQESDNLPNSISVPVHLTSGALAAGVSCIVSNPLDMIKTRLQTQDSLQVTRYRTIRQCIQVILQEYGYKGFFHGTMIRMMYLCPSSAITLSLYEFFKKTFITWYDTTDYFNI